MLMARPSLNVGHGGPASRSCGMQGYHCDQEGLDNAVKD